jgi:hypothetical protein
MQDFTQQQGNVINDDSQQQGGATNDIPDDNALPVAFSMDLSGFKKEDNKSQTSNISVSPEFGPIVIDTKPEIKSEQKVEFGNEALENMEKEHNAESAEKKETNAPEAVSNQAQSTNCPINDAQNVKAEKTEVADLPKKILPTLKFDGFPIDPELIDPEEIKIKKGKGDPGNGLTAVYLFLDKLLRKQGELK